jgi:hypothetical protein
MNWLRHAIAVMAPGRPLERAADGTLIVFVFLEVTHTGEQLPVDT